MKRRKTVHARFPRGPAGAVCGVHHATTTDDPAKVTCQTCAAYVQRHRGLFTPALPACRVCGCTDADCSGCIARTGAPCSWVERDLCSACVGGQEPRAA